MQTPRTFFVAGVLALAVAAAGCSQTDQHFVSTQAAGVSTSVAGAGTAVAGAGTSVAPRMTELAHTAETVVAAVTRAPLTGSRKIGIDPGHGWAGDTGAVNATALVNEKDINLDIAFRTRAILESKGYAVVMTRQGDDSHTLTRTVEVINDQKPDIVVSIHANSGPAGTGTEACYTRGKDTDEASKKLAMLLASAVSHKLNLALRGVYPEDSDTGCARELLAGDNQLYIHAMNPPAALLETAFISNAGDVNLLKNHSQDIAQAIADAVEQYYHQNP